MDQEQVGPKHNDSFSEILRKLWFFSSILLVSCLLFIKRRVVNSFDMLYEELHRRQVYLERRLETMEQSQNTLEERIQADDQK